MSSSGFHVRVLFPCHPWNRWDFSTKSSLFCLGWCKRSGFCSTGDFFSLWCGSQSAKDSKLLWFSVWVLKRRAFYDVKLVFYSGVTVLEVVSRLHIAASIWVQEKWTLLGLGFWFKQRSWWWFLGHLIWGSRALDRCPPLPFPTVRMARSSVV